MPEAPAPWAGRHGVGASRQILDALPPVPASPTAEEYDRDGSAEDPDQIVIDDSDNPGHASTSASGAEYAMK